MRHDTAALNASCDPYIQQDPLKQRAMLILLLSTLTSLDYGDREGSVNL